MGRQSGLILIESFGCWLRCATDGHDDDDGDEELFNLSAICKFIFNVLYAIYAHNFNMGASMHITHSPHPTLSHCRQFAQFDVCECVKRSHMFGVLCVAHFARGLARYHYTLAADMCADQQVCTVRWRARAREHKTRDCSIVSSVSFRFFYRERAYAELIYAPVLLCARMRSLSQMYCRMLAVCLCVLCVTAKAAGTRVIMHFVCMIVLRGGTRV